MNSNTIRLAEKFESIQGEGLFAGTPSLFVRLSGCNLRCVWCDTPYASWNPEGPVVQVDDLIDEIRRSTMPHVVFTGGEPMLFDALETLAEGAKAAGKVVTIETAGTIERRVACDLMSISPKLANSTPPKESGWMERHERSRRRPEVIASLIGHGAYQLKFVVGLDLKAELDEIDGLLRELPPIDPQRVILMPEGTTAETIWTRARSIVPICLERGWRFGPRLHVDLFGNTRGT